MPQVPLAESFARLNEYPDGTFRELREAAASYSGVAPGADRRRRGRRRADRDLRRGRSWRPAAGRRSSRRPTASTGSRRSSRAPRSVAEPKGADLIWVCNPNNPTGELRDPAEIAALARAHPQAAVVVDEAYWEFAGVTCVPLVAELPNLIVLRTLSKAFGFAALRVGYAVAAAGDRGRARAAPAAGERLGAGGTDRGGGAAGAAARRRGDGRRARAGPRSRSPPPGYDCPETHGNFVWVRSEEHARRAPRGRRARRPDLRRGSPDLAAAAARERRPARSARRDEPARARARGARRRARAPRRRSRLVARPRRHRPRARRDRDRLSRSPADALRLPRRLRPRAARGRRPRRRRAPHGRGRPRRPRRRARAARSATVPASRATARPSVPMDEALATAAVDLVRRPHAEVELAFAGDRIGGLAPSLLPHALERLAMQGGFTLHVSASGTRRPPRRRGGVQGARPGAPAGVRARRRRHPLDEGPRVKVVLADYGAGNLRSVCAALARAGASPAISTDPAAVREAPLAVIAGVGHVESAARGLGAGRRRAARAGRRRPPAARDLRRHAAPVRGERGRRARARAADRAGAAAARAARAAHGLERARAHAAVGAARRARRRGRLLRAQLRGRAGRARVGVAEVEHDGPRRRRRRVRRRSRASSSTPSAAAPRARELLENALRWSRSA